MTARVELHPDEQAELARLLAALPGRRDSLGALLHRWRTFVAEVERGYGDSVYDYTNDLTVRDRLERVFEGASPGLRRRLAAAAADDDRRFEAATEEAAQPLTAAPSWWWRRIPRRRVGDFADDLASL